MSKQEEAFDFILREVLLLAGILIGWTYRFDSLRSSIISLLFTMCLILIITYFGLNAREEKK